MLNNKHLKLKITAIVLATIVVVVGLFYLLGLYPIAKVGSKYISNKTYEKNLAIAKQFDPNPDREEIYNLLIQSKQLEELMEKYDINKSEAVEAELKYFKTGNLEEYNELLNKYFSNSEKLFVDFVVERESYNAMLQVKYNSDFGINNNAYNKADNILKKLQTGTPWEELVVTSEDRVSGQVDGDLGFVASGEILPELEKALNNSTIGEVKKELVVSRLGYHILYPVEVSEKDGQKVWHVKHILIQTNGYDQWLDNQLKTIKVKKFGGK